MIGLLSLWERVSKNLAHVVLPKKNCHVTPIPVHNYRDLKMRGRRRQRKRR